MNAYCSLPGTIHYAPCTECPPRAFFSCCCNTTNCTNNKLVLEHLIPVSIHSTQPSRHCLQSHSTLPVSHTEHTWTVLYWKPWLKISYICSRCTRLYTSFPLHSGHLSKTRVDIIFILSSLSVVSSETIFLFLFFRLSCLKRRVSRHFRG